MDREKVIKALHDARRYLEDKEWSDRGASPYIDSINDAIALLKEQQETISRMIDELEEEPVVPWEHIWDAPDYTFKGQCKKCGFIYYFIQGHDAQYRFCPQCGEQKVID